MNASVFAELPRGVTGPIGLELRRLALPIFASQLLRVAYQWVDALWVRGLGVDATAAVTTSVFVMWAVYSLHDIFGLGVAAYVSQLLGAGERRRAGLAAWKGVRATGLTGLAGTVAGLFAARHIFTLMGGDAGVVDQGGRYLSVVLAAAPIPMMAFTCETIMRSSGDTRTPLLVDLVAVSLNALLDPLLIYGWGPFPRLGIAGAAWATVIAQLVMLATYFSFARRGYPSFPLARSAPGPPVRIAGMVRVGIPGAAIGLLFSVVYIAFTRAAAAYGPAAMAVVGIANRVEALQFLTSASIGIAGATLVGQNLGARRPDRAVQVILTGNRWGLWVAVTLTVVFLAAPGLLLGMFSRDPGVHALGVPYLRVLSLCLVFTSVEIVTAESILGSGHTLAISWIYTLFSLLRIPLAFVVPNWMGLGVTGIAWLITVTCALRTLLIVAWAARGSWKSGLQRELHGAGEERTSGISIPAVPPEAP